MPNPRDPNWNGKVLCECAECGGEIYKEYEFVIDDEENYFCDDDCAMKFHGIRTVDFESLRPEY